MSLFRELNREPRIQPDNFMASVRINATNCLHYVYLSSYLSKHFSNSMLTQRYKNFYKITLQHFLWLPPPSGKVHLPRPIHGYCKLSIPSHTHTHTHRSASSPHQHSTRGAWIHSTPEAENRSDPGCLRCTRQHSKNIT